MGDTCRTRWGTHVGLDVDTCRTRWGTMGTHVGLDGGQWGHM